ncbi:MAG: peptidoglycan bridge formation glycyltransferase FemA/FemB family protein [Candidatus Cloacimonetes bacterium]|nr:peptidoglycan bridge formation glycyltransferase FemA/FemB family protein [Candidatus Cloacimonadota bacterium]
MLKLTTLQRADYFRYESFLEKVEGSLFYHSSRYKELLESLLDVKSTYQLVLDQNGEIQAVCPFMVKHGTYGPVLNSLPFYGSNGGILAKTDEAYNFLEYNYIKLAKNFVSSCYISNPLIEKETIINDYMEKRISQWTDLGSKDQIWSSYSSSAKRNVRKALKSKVQVQVSNHDFKFLYDVHLANMTTIGGLAKSREFFSLVPQKFNEDKDFKVFIATVNDTKIAALLLFYHKDTVEYFTPVTNLDFRSFQPMALIIYQAMMDACDRGFKKWNWGGTWLTQDGVYKFKKNFGAHDLSYYYYIKINDERLCKLTKQDLLDEYPNFFVLPFDKLRG